MFTDWTTPAITASILSVMVLVVAYWYARSRHRDPFLHWWAWAWTLYAGRYIFLLAGLHLGNPAGLAMAEHLCTLSSAYALYRGTSLLGPSGGHRVWLGAGLAAGAWTIAALALALPELAVTLPLHVYTGAIRIYTGMIFLGLSRPRRFGETLTGVSLVLWGLHRLDYPFLVQTGWIAPWGFLLGATLGLLVALAQLLWHFEMTAARLSQSERRYRLLFRKMQNGFALNEMILDENGKPKDFRFLEVNPAFESLTGLHASEIVGRTAREVIPDLEEFWIERYGQVVLTGEPSRFENYNSALDKYFSVVAYRPSPMHFAVIFSDITEIRESREKLAENEERMRTLVENIPGAVFRCANDRGWTVSYMSEGVEDVTGYPARDFLATEVRSYADLIHPDDRDAVFDAVQQAAQEKGVFNLEYRIRHKEGGVRWIHEKGRGMYGKDGELEWLDGVILDVTDRKEIENDLRKALAFNQMILGHTPVNVSVYDGESGRCLMANEVLSGNLNEGMDRLSGDFRENPFWRESGLTALAEEALAGGGLRRKDVNIADASGRPLTLDCIFVRFDVDDKPFLLRVVADISERVRMEEILIQTEKMMSVGGLAAGMAHEINNPLGGIIQGSQVVLSRLSSDSARNRNAANEVGCRLGSIHQFIHLRGIDQMMDHIRDAATRAARIVAGMLEFARQGDARHAPEDIREVLDMTLELCASDYDLTRKYDFRHLRVERHYEEDLPPVDCSRTQIEQVFLNILRNCAQAMPLRGEGREAPRIILRASREGSFARVEIEDNGPGIDAATRRRIFEPFFTTKPPGEGTGLGLSVSYFIVTENHRGTIAVESEPGKGATFIIRLPLADGQTGETEA